MASRMYVILAYDISVERLNKARQFLRQYLDWIQNSVFEGELTKGELQEVKQGLTDLINEDEDSIIIFTARSKKWVDKENIGIKKKKTSRFL